MEDQTMPFWNGSEVHPKKRRRTFNNNCAQHEAADMNLNIENSSKISSFRPCCKRFLPIMSSEHIYESQDCKPKGETLYTSLKDDVLVNVQNIEQFSFAEGSYFIVDEASRFVKSVQGNVCFYNVKYA